MPSTITTTFTDPYEYQKSIRPSDAGSSPAHGFHENVQICVTARGEFDAGLTQIDLQRLWVQRGWTSLPLVSHEATPKDRNPLFFLTDAPQIPVFHSGIEIAPGDLVLEAAGTDNHLRLFGNCCWGGISVTPEDLATAGRALTGRELAASAVTRVLRPEPALMSRLLNLHKAASYLAVTAPDILAHPEVAKAIEQELVRAVIACLTEPTRTAEPRLNRQKVMRRFEQLIEAHQDEPLYITDVCVAIGVPERTLRQCCQQHLKMSPNGYPRLRRMNLVRRALILADPTATTVTAIANDYGFGEVGRFAVDYRKLFGEAPSATLRRPPDPLRSYIRSGRSAILSTSSTAASRLFSP